MATCPRRWCLLALLPLALAVGCGKGSNKLAVSGTVTWKGQPLQTGMIGFVPADAGVTTEVTSVVTNGAFSIPQTDGLLPGRYKVWVSSPDPKTQAGPEDAAPGDRGGYPAKDRLPADYTTAAKTKLSAEVKAGQENRFEFTIP